jgi:hypothetical protein
VQLGGEPDDLLSEFGVLCQQDEVLFIELSFAPKHLSLADFELAFSLKVCIVLLPDRDVSEFVAFGLAGLASRINGAAYAAWVENARLSRMNG